MDEQQPDVSCKDVADPPLAFANLGVLRPIKILRSTWKSPSCSSALVRRHREVAAQLLAAMLQKLRPPPRPCPFLDKDVGEMAAVVSCSRGHSAGRRFLSRGLDSSNRTLELYRPAGNLFPRRAFACPRFQISSSGRVLGHPRVVNCSSSRCFADPGIEEGVLLPASEPNVPVAVQAIKSGKVIAVPTDTIYGFACDACSAEAIRRIYEIKGRQATKPLAVCVAEVSDIPRFARTEHLPPGLLDCLLPGPVTVILGRGESSALEGSLNPGVDSIGVRVPDCDRAASGFRTSPSSGATAPSSTTAASFRRGEPAPPSSISPSPGSSPSSGRGALGRRRSTYSASSAWRRPEANTGPTRRDVLYLMWSTQGRGRYFFGGTVGGRTCGIFTSYYLRRISDTRPQMGVVAAACNLFPPPARLAAPIRRRAGPASRPRDPCLRGARRRTRLWTRARGTGESDETRRGEEERGKSSEMSGTVFGAVSLIIGTSIGSGMLALPQRTSHAGFVPSAIFMAACWAFLMLEALLLTEVNVFLMRERRAGGESGKTLDVISFRTMAEETLGEWGAQAATVAYVFLAYTSTTAYAAKAGELLSRLLALPTSVAGALFTLLHAALIVVGGAAATDRVNQCLTTSMLGLLLGVELMALSQPSAGLTSAADWGEVPSTIPVIIFSLVYHDIAPVICSYLGGDLARIRSSLVIGSVIPLLSLLAWDAIVLGFSDNSGAADPLELFMRGTGGAMGTMVEAFSLLAVGTSLIGTLLGFSQFFKEQLRGLRAPPSPQKESVAIGRGGAVENWWGGNKINLGAMSMAVVPALLASAAVPDAFYFATDIAGGYCMTVLYGILPPAMAWGLRARRMSRKDDADGDRVGGLAESKPALIGAGLCGVAIVVDQMLQDLSTLDLHL
ncbi:DHBP synthase RibB-like alpha/beta domain-containing protein [Wolffia australiana]